MTSLIGDGTWPYKTATDLALSHCHLLLITTASTQFFNASLSPSKATLNSNILNMNPLYIAIAPVVKADVASQEGAPTDAEAQKNRVLSVSCTIA